MIFHLPPRCPVCQQRLPWQVVLEKEKHIHTCVHCQSKLKYTKINTKDHSFGFWLMIHLLEGCALLPVLLLFALLDTITSKTWISGLNETWNRLIVMGLFILLLLLASVAIFIWKHCYTYWKPKCKKCGYSLQELQSDSCPECGLGFDRESLWFKEGVVIKNKLVLPMSIRRVSLMVIGFFIMGIVITAGRSIGTSQQWINIGWPIPVFNYNPGYYVDYQWQWVNPLCDFGMYILAACGIEYVYQWLKHHWQQRDHNT